MRASPGAGASVTATTEIFDDPAKRFSDLALKDYELKVAYLTAHFQRMWTRFNYFVVIEAALIGGRTVFGDATLGVPGLAFGACLSFIWYVMGAEDRYLVQVYRGHVNEAAALLDEGLLRSRQRRFRPVGDLSGAGQRVAGSISGWRIEALSTTRLAALIPLAVTIAWLGMLARALAA
jgi:hypothetical protein